MKNSKLIITLDGPSGSGKSTISHRLAQYFQVPCLDTGAMYRMVALKSVQKKIDLDQDVAVSLVAQGMRFRFVLKPEGTVAEVSDNGGSYVTIGREIRTPEISMAASRIAKLKGVRQIMVAAQQAIGAESGAVVEGRDAGTVIFPSARFKFYMTASDEERAQRRFKELQERLGPQAPSYKDVLAEMLKRDTQDAERIESPMKPADDAVLVDTTGLDLDQVLKVLIQEIESRKVAT